jgi:hypothetical protein
MNLEHVETDLHLETYHSVPVRFRAGIASTTHGETAAHRLRAKGLSYRRIALQLRVRYDLVSRWLSGPRPSEPAPETVACSPASPPRLEAVSIRPDRLGDSRELTRRIDELGAALRQVSQESREREAGLRQLIQEELNAANERETRRNAEIITMRATLDVLAARVGLMTGQAAVQPPKQGFWRWGVTR